MTRAVGDMARIDAGAQVFRPVSRKPQYRKHVERPRYMRSGSVTALPLIRAVVEPIREFLRGEAVDE